MTKRAYQVSDGAYFVPTYYDTTIVQSFDARAIVEISGPSVEEEDADAREKAKRDVAAPEVVGPAGKTAR